MAPNWELWAGLVSRVMQGGAHILMQSCMTETKKPALGGSTGSQNFWQPQIPMKHHQKNGDGQNRSSFRTARLGRFDLGSSPMERV